MDNHRNTPVSDFMAVYKVALRWAGILFAELFALWSLLQYVILKLPYINYTKNFLAVIVIAAAIYLGIASRRQPETIDKVWRFLKANCGFEQLFLTALFFWYILVCAIHENGEGIPYLQLNDRGIFIVGLSAFVLFPFSNIVGRKRARKIIEGMIHSMTIIYTWISAWALTKWFAQEETILPSGEAITMHKGEALRIGAHPNITGILAVIMIGFCLYMILLKRIWVKIAYTAAMLVHMMVVGLSNSRTSFVIMVCMVLTILVIRFRDRIAQWKLVRESGERLLHFEFINKLKAGRTARNGQEAGYTARNGQEAGRTTRNSQGAGRNRPSWELPEFARTRTARIVLGVAAAALFIFVLVRLRIWLVSTSADMIGRTDTMRARWGVDLNGRGPIWQACFAVMFASPQNFFFGITPANVREQLFATGLIEIYQPHAHNVLLQVGTSLGVPAMVLYIVFLVRVCARCVRIIWMQVTGNDNRVPSNMWIVSVIVICLIMVEMIEVMTFAILRFNVFVFFVLAGWVVSVDRRVNGPVKIPIDGIIARLRTIKH